MRARFLLLMGLVAAGCQDNPVDESELDEAYYRCRVQPVFDARCSMLECHGTEERPLRVFSRNRLRLDADPVQLNLPMSDEELVLNRESAVGFVDGEDPHRSMLSRKPLDEDAGGYYHEGRELYLAGDVFADEDDDDYQTLLAWVSGESEDPACSYAGLEEVEDPEAP